MDTMSEGTINRFYKKQFKTSKERKKERTKNKKKLPVADYYT